MSNKIIVIAEKEHNLHGTIRLLKRAGYYVETYYHEMQQDEMATLEDAEALIIRDKFINQRTIQRMKSCKVIIYIGRECPFRYIESTLSTRVQVSRITADRIAANKNLQFEMAMEILRGLSGMPLHFQVVRCKSRYIESCDCTKTVCSWLVKLDREDPAL